MAFKTAQNQGTSMTNEMKRGWRPMKVLITILTLLFVGLIGSVAAYMFQRSENNSQRIEQLEKSNGVVIERLNGLSKQMDFQYESLKTLIQQQ